MVLLTVPILKVPSSPNSHHALGPDDTVAGKTVRHRNLIALVISVLLLGFITWIVGIKNVLDGLSRFPLWAVFCILLLLSANLVTVSLRYWRVLAHFGIALPWKIALQANIAGNIAGFILISLAGHVVGRQIVLKPFNVSPIVNASLVAYERVLLFLVSGGLGALGGMYILGQSAVASFLDQIAIYEIAIAALVGVMLSTWLGHSNFERRLCRRMLSVSNFRRLTIILGLTLAGQLLMLGAFMIGIYAIADGTPLVSMFAASAAISFAATIPITINGWGIREVAAVYLLGRLGLASGDALSVSVMIGLCATAVTLAASFNFLRQPSHV